MKYCYILGAIFTCVSLVNGRGLENKDPLKPVSGLDGLEGKEEDIVDVAPAAEEGHVYDYYEHEEENVQTTTNDPLARDRHNAMQVIVEKLFIALGPGFPPENQVLPMNESLPTVVTPLNITLDPCPDIYTKCSTEMFLPSCKNPRNSNPLLWSSRFNLYFNLPNNLLQGDDLLNATLKLYKTSELPLHEPTELTVELHRYIKSLTKKRDVHIIINSTKVMSDVVGWISIDVTDLIRKLKPKRNHGFLINFKDAEGILWNAPNLFTPMDCTSDDLRVFLLPFGVQTNQPEQRFPSLHITTGSLDPYYTELKTNDFAPLLEGIEKAVEKEVDRYILSKKGNSHYFEKTKGRNHADSRQKTRKDSTSSQYLNRWKKRNKKEKNVEQLENRSYESFPVKRYLKRGPPNQDEINLNEIPTTDRVYEEQNRQEPINKRILDETEENPQPNRTDSPILHNKQSLEFEIKREESPISSIEISIHPKESTKSQRGSNFERHQRRRRHRQNHMLLSNRQRNVPRDSPRRYSRS